MKRSQKQREADLLTLAHGRMMDFIACEDCAPFTPGYTLERVQFPGRMAWTTTNPSGIAWERGIDTKVVARYWLRFTKAADRV